MTFDGITFKILPCITHIPKSYSQALKYSFWWSRSSILVRVFQTWLLIIRKWCMQQTVRNNGANTLFISTGEINSWCVLKNDRYPECTSSVLQALMMFEELHSGYRTKEIENCIRSAATFIESTQGDDGSWFVVVPHYRETILLLLLQNFMHNTISTLAG